MLIVVGSNNIKKNVCTSFYQHEICIIHKLEADKRRLVEAVLGHMETKLNSLGRTPLTAFPIACLSLLVAVVRFGPLAPRMQCTALEMNVKLTSWLTHYCCL